MRGAGFPASLRRKFLIFILILAPLQCGTAHGHSVSLSITNALGTAGYSSKRPEREETGKYMASVRQRDGASSPVDRWTVHPEGNRRFPMNPAAPKESYHIMRGMEERLSALGLVNVKDIDGTLLVDLKYASPHNFMGAAVYGDLRECYLQREPALMLKKAHDRLKAIDPGLRLLVADGFRPRSVQRRMWEIVKDTPMHIYVANPASGSMHNYGAAVDVTIVDDNGNRMDMGTPMDHFGILAHPREEQKLLKQGKLTEQQVSARRLLREVMTRAGFQHLGIEWWHFNACDRQTVAKKYKIIE